MACHYEHRRTGIRANPGTAPCEAKGTRSMNNALKKKFAPFLNEQSLRSAIESVCAKFGKVTYLQILPASRRPNLQCACIVQLDTAAAHAALRSKLNAVEIEGSLCFFADVDERWTGDRAKIAGYSSADAPFSKKPGQPPSNTSKFAHTGSSASK
jgi:hypothetical protein